MYKHDSCCWKPVSGPKFPQTQGHIFQYVLMFAAIGLHSAIEHDPIVSRYDRKSSCGICALSGLSIVCTAWAFQDSGKEAFSLCPLTLNFECYAYVYHTDHPCSSLHHQTEIPI
jgi:hypothetical protein